jgi:predicted Zn-dependent protease
MRILLSALLLLATALPAIAKDGEHDAVFKAMTDELDRSMTKLELKGHPKPYYVSYLVREYDARNMSASFGAITDNTQNHMRDLICDVRIGDYKQDSSAAAAGRFASLFGGESSLSVDDNYDALRRELWLQTDSAYKKAIERMKAIEIYLKQHTIEDKPDSFSREKPTVHIEPLSHVEFDTAKWEDELRTASAVFRDYPDLSSSRADVVVAGEDRWFLNSEGFRYRMGESGFLAYLSAQAMAPDGMRLTDDEMMPAWHEKDLPTTDQLKENARALAERLKKLAAAPIVSNYRGPVMFEGQAGGEFFHQLLDSKLAANGGGIHIGGGSGDMQERLGERILPKFISVVDDPTAKEFNGVTLFGNYEVDDEGVEGQKITLIEKGLLKTLCMGRTPTRAIKASNGHFKNGAAVTSNVIIESENKLSAAALKARLIELGKEDGLKEVYIVRKLISNPVESGATMIQSLLKAIASGGGDATLYPPVMIYKVSTEDGHEELCRGASFVNVSMRVLRDIDATGDDTKAYPVIGQGNSVTSIVAPSVVVKEIEIQRPERTTSKGPVLKNPYFDKDQ